MSMFHPATRKKVRLRMALDGVSGSGKTFTALRFAFALGKRVAVINSESGAVEKYLGLAPDGIPWQFDICTLENFAPTSYTEAILAAGKEGYDVVIVDSLSHAWAGSGGALEIKDKKGGNSFTAWKDITPMHNRMIEGILHSPCHVIATMRSKTDFVLELDQNGKQVPRKVGLAPVQRAGMEYEFDVYASIDNDHILKVTKSRCPEIDGAVSVKPTASFMAPVIDWLNTGSDVAPDFYAVTDADLARHAKKEADAKPPAPRKTAAELMAEQAASAAGAGATDFRTRITSLFDQLGVSEGDRTKILAKRKVVLLSSLSDQQATELIAGLEKKLAEAAAASQEATAEASKLPPEATVTTPAGLCFQPQTGPCFQPQIDEIKSLLKEMEQVKPGTMDGFASRLEDAGKQRISDLSQRDAEKVLGGLRVKNLEWFFTASLENWNGDKPVRQPGDESTTGEEVQVASIAKAAAVAPQIQPQEIPF